MTSETCDTFHEFDGIYFHWHRFATSFAKVQTHSQSKKQGKTLSKINAVERNRFGKKKHKNQKWR